jgi:hypothetical protein
MTGVEGRRPVTGSASPCTAHASMARTFPGILPTSINTGGKVVEGGEGGREVVEGGREGGKHQVN